MKEFYKEEWGEDHKDDNNKLANQLAAEVAKEINAKLAIEAKDYYTKTLASKLDADKNTSELDADRDLDEEYASAFPSSSLRPPPQLS